MREASAVSGAARSGARRRRPYVIPLTDGDANPAYYEHDWAATALAIPLAEPHDLELRGDRLRLDGRPVDVV
jgi:uncharacterized circularly permuted ATP-grasp superfamily protein